jgi:hypothetical protein
MNRRAIGALCGLACLVSMMKAKRRRALSAFALEQLERVFDVVENTLHLA